MPDFDSLLRAIARRPAMSVGRCSVRAISAFLDGYSHAMRDLDHDDPLDRWGRWVELRFLISHPAWHWTRILLHVYGDDPTAIAALPELYAEFDALRAEIGTEGIAVAHEQRFLAEYGHYWHEPAETTTTIDW